MKSIDKIKYQGECYDDNQESHKSGLEIVLKNLTTDRVYFLNDPSGSVRFFTIKLSYPIPLKELRVLDDNGFDHITCIFAFIRNDFHYLVDLAFLDHFFRVRFSGKEFFNAHIENIIGLVFDAVDLDE